jgi:hypothetical protein
MQLHLMAESCTICSSRSRRPVQKILDTPSYVDDKLWRIYKEEAVAYFKYIPTTSKQE